MKLLLVLLTLLALLSTGCLLNRINDNLMAPKKVVSGTIVEVKHDESYEAGCGLMARIRQQCNDVPICCAYQIVVRDSSNHDQWFFAFWPKYALGLARGRKILATLRRDEVIQFGKCNTYACPRDIAYVLEGDDDWRYID